MGRIIGLILPVQTEEIPAEPVAEETVPVDAEKNGTAEKAVPSKLAKKKPAKN